MLPSSTIDNTASAQHRLKRFIRQPDRLADRQLTPKGLELLATVERYHLLPSSMLVRLVAGDRSNNYRHLQTLFHKGLVNRFAMPTIWGTPGEFVYYLDTATSLKTLEEHGLVELAAEKREQRAEITRYNRQKNWAGLHKDPDMQGKLLYIQHELMVSRFRFMLEMACRHPKLFGKVTLEQWKQGPKLWNRVEVPKLREDREAGSWLELRETELLPHRPDAFFTLRFAGNPSGKERSHFFYEADRGTENTTRYKMKLRAHWHFIVKNNFQRTAAAYQVHSIRAVLTETTSTKWRNTLRQAAAHPIVSKKPSPLFWFASSEDITAPVPEGKKTVPRYLVQPEVIFSRLWHGCVDNNAFNLAE